MQHTNYPYNLFNQEYINQNNIYNAQSIHNSEQKKNIENMVKAISDYCEAARKITPDYQQTALNACLAEIVAQMSKNR